MKICPKCGREMPSGKLISDCCGVVGMESTVPNTKDTGADKVAMDNPNVVTAPTSAGTYTADELFDKWKNESAFNRFASNQKIDNAICRVLMGIGLLGLLLYAFLYVLPCIDETTKNKNFLAVWSMLKGGKWIQVVFIEGVLWQIYTQGLYIGKLLSMVSFLKRENLSPKQIAKIAGKKENIWFGKDSIRVLTSNGLARAAYYVENSNRFKQEIARRLVSLALQIIIGFLSAFMLGRFVSDLLPFAKISEWVDTETFKALSGKFVKTLFFFNNPFFWVILGIKLVDNVVLNLGWSFLLDKERTNWNNSAIDEN